MTYYVNFRTTAFKDCATGPARGKVGRLHHHPLQIRQGGVAYKIFFHFIVPFVCTNKKRGLCLICRHLATTGPLVSRYLFLIFFSGICFADQIFALFVVDRKRTHVPFYWLHESLFLVEVNPKYTNTSRKKIRFFLLASD